MIQVGYVEGQCGSAPNADGRLAHCRKFLGTELWLIFTKNSNHITPLDICSNYLDAMWELTKWSLSGAGEEYYPSHNYKEVFETLMNSEYSAEYDDIMREMGYA